MKMIKYHNNHYAKDSNGQYFDVFDIDDDE